MYTAYVFNESEAWVVWARDYDTKEKSIVVYKGDETGAYRFMIDARKRNPVDVIDLRTHKHWRDAARKWLPTLPENAEQLKLPLAYTR